jgi:hypothetical protein
MRLVYALLSTTVVYSSGPVTALMQKRPKHRLLAHADRLHRPLRRRLGSGVGRGDARGPQEVRYSVVAQVAVDARQAAMPGVQRLPARAGRRRGEHTVGLEPGAVIGSRVHGARVPVAAFAHIGRGPDSVP